MPSDVIKKAINANSVVQGAAIIATVSPVLSNKTQSIDPKITKNLDNSAMSGVELKYDKRFMGSGLFM